jgi:hypothetical protein
LDVAGEAGYANLNTAAFDRAGVLWFTGQAGVYGRLAPGSGEMRVWKDPDGPGPYGITTTPDGRIFYASLAGSHIAEIDSTTGEKHRIDPPTAGQGARRVWADSKGDIWVSEWNSGQLSRYTPANGTWKAWKLPGAAPRAYAVYVDPNNKVWVSDFSANAVVSFDPATERFTASYPGSGPNANVRQILAARARCSSPNRGSTGLLLSERERHRGTAEQPIGTKRRAAAPCRNIGLTSRSGHQPRSGPMTTGWFKSTLPASASRSWFGSASCASGCSTTGRQRKAAVGMTLLSYGPDPVDQFSQLLGDP